MSGWQQRLLIALAILIPLALITVLVSVAIGPVWIPLKDVAAVLLHRAGSDGEVGQRYYAIITQLRWPRITMGMTVGAALAVAGAALQGLLRNPLADPYTLGISSGAAAGACLSLIFLVPHFGNLIYFVPVLSFVAGIITLTVVFYLARIDRRLQAETLVLAGIVVNTFMSSVISFLLTMAGENVHELIYWMMGSLALRKGEYAIVVAIILLAGVLVLWLEGRHLNILTLGDEEAHWLGVSVERTRKIILVAASLLTGAAVSVAGSIGFVGLVIPHMCRMVVGPDYRILIPVTAFSGGIFLVWADNLARTIFAPLELPVGVVTSFLGVPFFIYLLRRSRKEG
ncbi:MAG: cobalamin transport system permease protein [Eubacteriales bacterium]|nr:cobalamin transport system permease protein [Eubacteriales bacterium]MDN5363148.1 cobalamin transport system permease protein [Eubacteriales bacterium]